jgi:hypothetical protein
MKKIIFVLLTLFFLTSCGGPKLPDPNMKLPDSPPNSALMEPGSPPSGN